MNATGLSAQPLGGTLKLKLKLPVVLLTDVYVVPIAVFIGDVSWTWTVEGPDKVSVKVPVTVTSRSVPVQPGA